MKQVLLVFQYRKRYEVTCDVLVFLVIYAVLNSFNTASGMRSHVTTNSCVVSLLGIRFQYRKRYEVTCDCERRFRT